MIPLLGYEAPNGQLKSPQDWRSSEHAQWMDNSRRVPIDMKQGSRKMFDRPTDRNAIVPRDDVHNLFRPSGRVDNR